MVQFNITADPNVTLEQQIGFQMAAMIWSQFLSDDVTINLHVSATTGLNGDQAVGGAVPLFHETHYGVYQEYLEQDATSTEDASVLDALQDGNTVDVLIDTDGDPNTTPELVDGNTELLLTRAQAKALGMEETITLDDGTVWDRDVLQDPETVDGYIVINNSYDWSYDFTQAADVPEGALDFMTMALHEIGHTLGFVSGLDGLIDTFMLYSGELRTEGMTALDLMRYSDTSALVENPDGTVSDLTFGGEAYFSLDGGVTISAEFEEGDEYQASHWQRFQNAIGIMDPTLGYQERTDISQLDLQAFDVIGWDINYDALSQGLDLDSLYTQALQTVGDTFGVGVESVEGALANGQDWYTLGHGAWWEAFKSQMIDMGYGSWWQDFESDLLNMGYGSWWQAFEEQMLNMGYGSWWQAFEDKVLAMGYGSWWQDFETTQLNMGYGSWWQQFEPKMLEMGYGSWWQIFEQQMLAMGYGSWWQEFESSLLDMGYGSWWQAFEGQVLEMGYGSWWQIFEDKLLEMGYGSWWQEFEAQILEMGYGSWWQVFEMGYGSWWQMLELGYDEWFQQLSTFFSTLDGHQDANDANIIDLAQGLPDNSGEGIYVGGADDDIIGGTQLQDRVAGGDGDDLIDGKEGDDVLWGDAGRDILYGHNGKDVIYGGRDDDLLLGENDNDQVFGEAGDDVLSGGQGHDILSGGQGRDELKGGLDSDVLAGGQGDDWLKGEDHDDLLMGNEGKDLLAGGQGNDIVYGDRTPAEGQAALAALLQQFFASLGNPDASSNLSFETNSGPNGFIRIEAEDMGLVGFQSVESGNASGDAMARLTAGSGTLSTTFGGPTGNYMVVVNYLDESDGQSTATVKLNGTEIDTWQFTQDNNQFNSRTISTNITLTAGDTIEILGAQQGSEYIQFDYLDIVPVDSFLTTTIEPTLPNEPISLLQNSDFQASLDGWELYSGNANIVNGISDDPSALNLAGSGNNYLHQSWDFEVGETYTLSVVAQFENGDWGSVGVNFYDSNSQKIQTFRTIITSPDWQQYTQTFVAPTNAAYAQAFVSMDGLAPLLIEDFSLFQGGFAPTVSLPSPTPRSLVSNGNFETGLTAWTASTGDIQIDQSTEGDASTGQFLTLNSENSSIYQSFQITSGETYEIKAYAKFTGQIRSGFRVKFYDINWQAIGQNNFYQVSGSDWATYQHQITAPEDSHYAIAYVNNHDDIGVLSIDDITFTRIDATLPGSNLTSNETETPPINNTSLGNLDKLNAGLIAHWTFDESTGPVAADRINNADGSLLNMDADHWTRGKQDGALSFDGVNGSVQVNDSPHLRLGDNNADFSIALWLNLQEDATGAFRSILHKWDSQNVFGIWLNNTTNQLKFGISTTDINNNGTFSRAELELNEWNHIAYVKEGNQLSLYLNGQFDSSIALQGDTLTAEDLIELGGSVNADLDDVRLYNRVLSNNDIISLSQYNADVIEGGSGQDILYGDEGDDVIYGEFANTSDSSTSTDADNDTIVGGTGNDHLYGNLGNDILYGDTATTLADGVIYSGSLYFLVQSAIWTDAQAQAESWGGNLVTINNATEEAWLRQTFGTDEMWIGLHDSNVEGQFEWVSGEEVTYTNWDPGNPDNLNGNQHYVTMNYTASGQWDDSPNDLTFLGIELQGIVEIDLSTQGGNDILTGNVGNDTLYGELGDDILNGTSAAAAGYLEQDTLIGGYGQDRFILGDATQAYYDTGGNSDYALIKDFNEINDLVQLHGSAGNYSQQQQGQDTHLYLNGSDLIAIFENTASLNFSQGFSFV